MTFEIHDFDGMVLKSHDYNWYFFKNIWRKSKIMTGMDFKNVHQKYSLTKSPLWQGWPSKIVLKTYFLTNPQFSLSLKDIHDTNTRFILSWHKKIHYYGRYCFWKIYFKNSRNFTGMVYFSLKHIFQKHIRKTDFTPERPWESPLQKKRNIKNIWIFFKKFATITGTTFKNYS